MFDLNLTKDAFIYLPKLKKKKKKDDTYWKHAVLCRIRIFCFIKELYLGFVLWLSLSFYCLYSYLKHSYSSLSNNSLKPFGIGISQGMV